MVPWLAVRLRFVHFAPPPSPRSCQLGRSGSVVLEMVPVGVAARVTGMLAIPTIGIGAGPECDGQVLVWTDMAGLGAWTPRFAKRYAELGAALGQAAADYAADVRAGAFPDEAHSFAE